MKIHKAFLTHDGVAATTAGKVIDLGFNGDFDVKKTDWNTVFIQFGATASGTETTVTVYSRQDGITDIATSTYAIGTLVIPEATIQKGGVVGLPMPKNLKRYFTLGFTGTTTPTSVTAGITDVVDTDLNVLDSSSAFWTNYKASTGTSAVTEVRDATTADISTAISAQAAVTTSEISDAISAQATETTEEISEAISEHAELTTGVHGLT